MVCYHPLLAYKMPTILTDKGKNAVKVLGSIDNLEYNRLYKERSENSTYFLVPCGQCIGCRLDASRSWGVRGVHESKMHEKSCFLTLTYDDAHVPWSSASGEQTLNSDDLQKFWKRLRKNTGVKIRYISCGEYGEQTHRPHYHALVYGLDFPDKQLYKITGRGDKYYFSPFLNDTWKKGGCIIGDVNFLTCAYVGRYVVKKLKGAAGESEYESIQAPFIHASNKPGIGATWFEKYKGDVYPYDECIIDYNGNMRRIKPPRYYDKLLERENPEMYAEVKERRMRKAERFEEDFYNDRMYYKELYKMKIIDYTLRRDLE